MAQDLRNADNSVTQQGGTGGAAWVTQKGVYPDGATALSSSSGNVANSAAVATLASAAARTAYLTGFEVTAGGATAAALVTVTVAGVLGGTMSYTFGVPAGAAVAASPLTVEVQPPFPASGANVNIVVTVPALGAGNTNATVVARGFLI